MCLHARLSAPVIVALLVAALVAGGASLAAQQKPAKVRVHFWTAQPAPGEIFEPNQKERDDAVKDLHEVHGRLAKKEIEIAPKDASQVQVEVVKRGFQDASGNLHQGKSADAVGLTRLMVVTLRFGEYTTTLECRDRGHVYGWRGAATDCIIQIRHWVLTNQAQFK